MARDLPRERHGAIRFAHRMNDLAAPSAESKPLAGKLLLGAATLFSLGAFFLPYGRLSDEMPGLLAAFGPWAILAYVAIFVLWIALMLPSIPLMLLAGVLFGPWFGTLYATVGASLGTTTTFLVGRMIGRDTFDRWARNNSLLTRVDALSHSHGFWLVVLLRLLPYFPLNLLNYGFGLTRIRFRVYAITSFLMTIPGALMYAGAGDILKAAMSDKAEVSPTTVWVLVAVAAASLPAAWLCRRRVGKLAQRLRGE